MRLLQDLLPKAPPSQALLPWDFGLSAGAPFDVDLEEATAENAPAGAETPPPPAPKKKRASGKRKPATAVANSTQQLVAGKRKPAAGRRGAAKPARVKRFTGAAAFWTRAEDAQLRDAYATHGRQWELFRTLAVAGEYPLLIRHLGAPDSKCLRKRMDRLLAHDAKKTSPTYKA